MAIKINMPLMMVGMAITILVIGATLASALPVYEGTYVDMYLKQTTFPDNLSEEKIYLDKAEASTLYGHVGQGGPLLVQLSSKTDILDAANGFSDIKAVDGYIDEITITAPGYYFEDLIFSVNLGPNGQTPNTDLNVIAKDMSGKTDAFASWSALGDWGNGENRILVLSNTGNLMQSVTITSLLGVESLGGLDQLK